MSKINFKGELRKQLGDDGIYIVEYAVNAIARLLPHIEIDEWTEKIWSPVGCVLMNPDRKLINATISYGDSSSSSALSFTTVIRRKNIPGASSIASETIDTREKNICDLVVRKTSDLLTNIGFLLKDASSSAAILNTFDESIVSDHIQYHQKLRMPISNLLSFLHKLSEQSYENKALAFGCILDPQNVKLPASAKFPNDFLLSKKYKALSDGFRTAYHISTHGAVVGFIDLERFSTLALSEKNHFPDWAESMAKASRKGKCGILLSRQGDILVFDQGTLRFSYRFGQWQYWNHSHLINLLRDKAKAQRVSKEDLGRVVGAIYRASLDISFRRSGGLFVILHNSNSLHKIVRLGDAIADTGRSELDFAFDSVVLDKKFQSLPRTVAVELASLDGAVVIRNSGEIVAYGAILEPDEPGNLIGSEGSRTKSAIGASNYGLAVKISSDGEICVYHEGKIFIKV